MADVYLDIPPTDQVLVKTPHPNQILFEFWNPCRPINAAPMAVAVNVRNDCSPYDAAMYQNLFYGHEQLYVPVLTAISPHFTYNPVPLYTVESDQDSRLTYHYLTIRNLTLDNPNDFTPNELNRRCSMRLKDKIPSLKSVSIKCIVMEWSTDDRSDHYGTVKVYISREDVRDDLVALGEIVIDGRRCSLKRDDGRRINAFRCFRCQTYGDHDAGNCQEQQEYCLKCSGNHRFKHCLVKDPTCFRCINCLRAGSADVNHMAGTFYCPIEIEQRRLRNAAKEKAAARRRHQANEV